MKGWQCPVCDAVNAPSVQQCPCKGKKAVSADALWLKEAQERLDREGVKSSGLRVMNPMELAQQYPPIQVIPYLPGSWW